MFVGGFTSRARAFIYYFEAWNFALRWVKIVEI